MYHNYERAYAAVDLDAVRYNMEQMKQNIGRDTKILGVIKTDGYGHGAVPIAKELETIDYVYGYAVATTEEAMILRKCNIKKPILILGYTFPYSYEEMILNDIIPAVFQLETLHQLQTAVQELARKGINKKARVHVKVDTGMSRIGIMPDKEGMKFIHEMLQMKEIEPEGIFTHFARADETDKASAMGQIEAFSGFIKQIKEQEHYTFPVNHCSNSAGIVEIKEANMDLVRAGITLYGLWPSGEVRKDIIGLKSVLSLYSQVVYIKELEPGTAISYGGTYICPRKTRIATIPLGYGDGYPRMLSNQGSVLIRGQRAPICGRICMDQFMVDVTDIPDVKLFDKVTLIGKDGDEIITMEELGDISTRFNYELACDIGKRIPRVYLKNGEIVDSKDYFSDYR